MSKVNPQSKTGKGRAKKPASKTPARSMAVSKRKKAASSYKITKKKTGRASDESSLKTRLRYEKALAACAHELLVNPKSSRQPLQNSITHLLNAAQVSRVYIFENFDDPEDGLCVRQTLEAVAKGIKPEIDNPDLQHLPFISAGFGRWAKTLPKGKHISGKVARFPKAERAVLEPQDILSILVLPIFVGQEWYGFIGFDDCVNIRDWSEEDVRMLKTASEIIGGYLSQKKMEAELKETHSRLEVRLKEQRADLKSTHETLTEEVVKRKRSIEALEESEERFRSLVDQAPDPIFVRDFNGKLILVNPRACECLGYTREELLQMSIADIVVDFESKRIKEKFDQLPPGETFTVEGLHRRKDGTTFPVEAHLGTIFWGGQLRVLSIMRDITQRQKTEQELLKTKEEAEEASRAKSVFLSRVSHELRTPLNAILGFGQLLESYSSQPLSKLQHSQVKEILNAGQNLLELINDVLDLSNIESGNMALTLETIPLKDLLEESLGLVKTMAKDQGIAMQADLSELEGLTVSGDSTRLKQVFLNLLTNAIKYNRENGSIRIGVETMDENEVLVFVEDTGWGIPPDKQEIIFDPFQRLEAGPNPASGTGMGLSIVKNLLALMNGFIRLRSDTGKGSRFTVGLARHHPAEAPSENTSHFVPSE